MNTFEVAVLRILIKRQQPLKFSTLVRGFPDDCEDSVLSAISSLKLHGYVTLDDYQPNGYISINRERRKEILQIVDSDIYPRKSEAPHTRENYSASIEEKKVLLTLQQGIRSPEGYGPSPFPLCSLSDSLSLWEVAYLQQVQTQNLSLTINICLIRSGVVVLMESVIMMMSRIPLHLTHLPLHHSWL